MYAKRNEKALVDRSDNYNTRNKKICTYEKHTTALYEKSTNYVAKRMYNRLHLDIK